MRLQFFPGGLQRTPSRLVVAATVGAWWLAQPWLVRLYYFTQLERGAYRPDADSISIPIGEDWAIWLFASPIVVLIVLLGFLRYRSGVAYSFRPRRFYHVAILLVALGSSALIANGMFWDIRDGHPGLAIAQLPGIIALLWLVAGNLQSHRVVRIAQTDGMA